RRALPARPAWQRENDVRAGIRERGGLSRKHREPDVRTVEAILGQARPDLSCRFFSPRSEGSAESRHRGMDGGSAWTLPRRMARCRARFPACRSAGDRFRAFEKRRTEPDVRQPRAEIHEAAPVRILAVDTTSDDIRIA